VPPARGVDPQDRLQKRREGALFMLVAGFGLIFMGSWSVQFAIGGAVSVVLGMSGYLYYGYRLRRLKGDPWAYDPDLDGPESPLR
jgi:hypothetical protein